MVHRKAFTRNPQILVVNILFHCW